MTLSGFMSRWAILCTMLLAACGATPQQQAREVIDTIATTEVAVDNVSAQAYTDAARRALEAASTPDQYRAAMTAYDAIERGLRTLSASLHVADAIITLWDNGGVRSWPQAFACVVGALEGLRTVISAAGVALPPELVSALDLVHGVVNTDSCLAPSDAGVDGGAS